MFTRKLALLVLALCVGLFAAGCPQQPETKKPPIGGAVKPSETAAPSADEKAAAEEKAAEEKAAAEKKAEEEKAAAEKKAAEEKKATDEKAAAEKKAADEKAAAEKKAAEEKAAAEKKAAEEKAAAEKPAAQETKAVEKLVVFDGDAKGENAKGWAVPEGGKVTVASQDKEVRTKGKKTFEFHAAGNEWVSCGWNWFGWSPEDAATDISKQKNLSFWAKVTGDKKPPELKVALGANDKTETEMEDMLTYCPELMDGKWHEVVIPLKELDGKNALNKTKVWDIRFGCWSQDDMNFSLFVDEIGFDSRPTK